MACPSSGRPSCGLERWKRSLDVLAARLQEGWQLQHAPQRLDRLVNREAGIVGGNLEQDAAGLAKIDRAEILPVNLRCRLESVVLDDLSRHLGLGGVVRSAEGDVMDGAPPHASDKEAFGFAKVHESADRFGGGE